VTWLTGLAPGRRSANTIVNYRWAFEKWVIPEEQAAAGEFDRLVHDTDHDLGTLVSEYEQLEAAYREATTADEVVTQVINTTSLLRALITAATSAGQGPCRPGGA